MVQVAGIYNHTDVNKGIQLGLINYADSSSGIPIGLFSFVKKGVHQLEISGDEFIYFNLSFRTGDHAFYNLTNIGFTPVKGQSPVITLGYGLGTSFKAGRKLRSDVTLSTHYIFRPDFILLNSSSVKLYWGLEKHFSKKTAIAFGPTLNAYLVDTSSSIYPGHYDSIVPYTHYSTNITGDLLLRVWAGGRLSFRLF